MLVRACDAKDDEACRMLKSDVSVEPGDPGDAGVGDGRLSGDILDAGQAPVPPE
jgi:hypothetical protein